MKKNYFTLYFLGLFIFLGFLGCGASKEVKVEPPVIKESKNIEYILGDNQELIYKMSTDVKQIITMMGQEQVINISANQNYYLKSVGVAEDGKYKVEFYTDSLKVDADNPMVTSQIGDISFLAKKKSAGKLAKNGTVSDITEIDPIQFPEQIKAIGNQFNPKVTFSKFLLVFPEKELKIGDSWTESKNDNVDNMGGTMNIKSDISYTLQEEVDYKGHKANKIVSVVKLNISGKGSQMGQEINISGTGKADAEYYFAKKEGLLLGYKVEQSNDINAEVSGMGMTIPMTTITSTNVSLIK